MKIGIVLSSTPSYSETFFQSKITGLHESGVEVILFCQNKRKDYALCPVVEGAKVNRNPLLQSLYFVKEFAGLLPYLPIVIRYISLERTEKTRWGVLFKKIYLNSHLLKQKLDWLHFGFATMALGKETVAKAIGAKMAVSFRGYDLTVYPVKNPGCYKSLWKNIDKVHTISNSLLNLAKKHGLPDNIAYMKITPAIETTLFQANIQNRNEIDQVVIMTTGRLHWIKGYITTLEALAILKAEGINFTYKIVGEGQDHERIAFAAYQLGLKDQVSFMGRVPHDQIQKELEAADIYLQYSIQEGFCNAVLEAQAMGKLCIVSDGGGLSENVLDQQTGWIVPKYSPELLAEQIKKVLLLDSFEKSKISKTAIERVRKDFNIEKQQEEFLMFYET